MNSMFVLAIVAFAAIVSAYDIPEIPCTFTAKIEGKKEISGKFAKDFYYMQYNIADEFSALEGKMDGSYLEIPEKTITNMTQVYGYSTQIYVGGFFADHTSCSRLPVELEDSICFVIQDDAKYAGEEDCPSDSKYAGSRCDHYHFIKKKSEPRRRIDWFLLKGTNTPVQSTEQYLMIKFTYNIVSFDTSKEPDMEHFLIPDGCADYTVSGTPIYTSTAPVNHHHHAAKKFDPKVTQVNDVRRIAEINAKGLSWKAGPNKAFAGMTVEQFRKTMLTPFDTKRRLSNKRAATNSMSVAPEIHVDKIPESFDASKEWPGCNIIDYTRDQARCGSCWSFGSTVALGDRFCIAHNSTSFGALALSPQYAVDCMIRSDGCFGGNPDNAWEDLVTIGTVEESCIPYEGVDQECPTKCRDGSPLKIYKAKNAYPLYSKKSSKKTIEMIQKEIMTHGPVETGFYVFDDFMNYMGGVYHHPEGSGDGCGGAHAVKVYGWGVDEETGIPYWRVRDSWGLFWGESGGFRIQRGNNECGFEDEFVAGLPLLD